MPSGRLPCAPCLRFAQKALNISPQRDFHFRLRVFKAARLNIDGELLATTVPAIISEPKLAFDAQEGRDSKVYRMASHRFLPHDLSRAMITFALLRANEWS
jgi:hypothetical protein